MKNTEKSINKKVIFPFLSNEYKIENCRFKKFSYKNKALYSSNKTHQHIFTEVHLVICGQMLYEVCGKEIPVPAGTYILISPNTPHCRLKTSSDAQTYHLTYSLAGKAYGESQTESSTAGAITPQLEAALNQAWECFREYREDVSSVPGIVLFPVIYSLSNITPLPQSADNKEPVDSRLSLAKQFIQDNLRSNPKCEDIAQYCYLSVKQLSRLFHRYEGLSLKAYIDRQKFEAIESSLAQSDLTLKQISEYFGFCNEYYFNRFFKNHSGMCPGAYRDSIK